MSNLKKISKWEWEEYALGVIMMQYSIKAGLKKFGIKGEEAVSKEIKQLHDMLTFYLVFEASLTKQQKQDAVASLMFLKEKRDSQIKGRGCANCIKQWNNKNKEHATSPMASNEALFLTALITAMEGRDAGCFDILGAFLHVETDKEV